MYGSLPKDGSEIALLTKSGLEVMVELASWIDVPAEHLAEKRARPTRQERDIGDYRVESPLTVHHGSSAPEKDYVSARFRDTWFWIDDRDLNSKRTFMFLQFLFALAETGVRQLSPVVTVGAGG